MVELIPEFSEGNVPVRVAAKVLGMKPDTVRNRMEDGTLDLGVIYKSRKGTVKVVKGLAPQLMGVASAYAALKIISTVNGLITKSNALIKTAKATQEGLTTITLLHTSAIAKEAAAKGADIAVTKAQTLVQAAQNGTIGLGTAAIGILTGALTVHEAVTIASTAATTALTAALGFLTIP